jgi:hypothetical protein
MFNRSVGFVVSALALACAGAASAEDLCQAPAAPPSQSLRPIRPVKPDRPPCVNETTLVSTCRPAVLKAYNAAVEDYNAKLRRYNLDAGDYVDALNRWGRLAIDYTNCEITLLNRQQ